MANINITPDKFADIALMFLSDKIINPEIAKGNKNFDDFISENGTRIKAALLKYYLDTSSRQRVQYKRIRGIFDGTDKSRHQIRIVPSGKEKEEEEEEKESGVVSKIKKIMKKVLLKQSLDMEEENILNEFLKM